MGLLTLYQWRDVRWAAHWLAAGVHLLLSGILIWIGLDLLRPGSTFDISPVWNPFRTLCADENAWGAGYLLGGVFGLLGLGLSSPTLHLARIVVRSRTVDLKLPDGWLRLLSLWAISSAHGMTAIFFAIGSSITTASGTMGLIACAGYGLFWLIAWDMWR